MASVDALFTEAQRHNLRLITGKCLMDQNAPDGLRDETQQSLIDTEALINKWHGIDRLGYAITYYVGREGATKHGLSPIPQQLWWQHTAGAAQALGLAGVVGNLQPGCEADFVIINPQATPLLARKTAHANTLDELLFALIALGDDRLIEKTVISQAVDV